MAKLDESQQGEGIALGEAIRALREARGIKVSDLATALGVTQNAIHKIQDGSSTIQFLKFAKLCRVLGTTPNELLGFNVSNLSDETLLGVIEASYMSLGLTDAEAKVLAETVLEVAKQPPFQTVELPPRQAGRASGEILLRQGARPKKQ